MAVALAHALVAVQPDPVGEGVVVGRDEAAFAGRHVLGAVQAERAVPEAPDPAAAVLRAVRLAGVLDDGEAVALRQLDERVHVGGQAEQVDRADGLRPGRDGRGHAVRVDVVGLGVDVHEDRRGAGVQDRGHRRVERVADGDDLIARPKAHAREDAHLRDGPVAHRDRVADADERRPTLLELRDALATGQHPAAQDLGDGGDLGLVDVGAGDRDHAFASLSVSPVRS